MDISGVAVVDAIGFGQEEVLVVLQFFGHQLGVVFFIVLHFFVHGDGVEEGAVLPFYVEDGLHFIVFLSEEGQVSFFGGLAIQG